MHNKLNMHILNSDLYFRPATVIRADLCKMLCVLKYWYQSSSTNCNSILLKTLSPVTPACNIQINAHQSVTVLHEASETVVSLCVCLCFHVCVCLCVFVRDNGDPLMPESDLVQAFWRIISLRPPVKNFDEDPEERALIACTYCVNNEIVLEISTPSHLLVFQPYMQAVFHLSFPSSSVACNC